jgi:hypothetical protein
MLASPAKSHGSDYPRAVAQGLPIILILMADGVLVGWPLRVLRRSAEPKAKATDIRS